MGAAGPPFSMASPSYVETARRLSEAARPHLAAGSRRCLAAARDESRRRDDDHVGTEHILLALWAIGPNHALEALETVGVSRELFCAQLFDEPGTSPTGAIPFTPRALMIVGLAGLEASRLGSPTIDPEHILLGAIREDGDWETTKTGGPLHLIAACRAAGSDLRVLEAQIERRNR